MSDERDTSWDHESDRHRRHHPAIDRGRSVLRSTPNGDQWGDDRSQRGYPGNQGYDPRVTDPYARDTGDYAVGYGEQDYAPSEYDAPADYGQAHDPRIYDPRTHDPRAQDPRIVDPRRPDPHGYDGRGQTDSRGYDARAQGRGYDPQGLSAPGYPDPGYPDPGYPDPQYRVPGYPAQDYPDAGYPEPGYPEAGYPEAGYPGSGLPDPGYPAPGYDQPGYDQPGYAGAYQSSFIERGFDEESDTDPRRRETNGRTSIGRDTNGRDTNGRDTNGRGARAVSGDEYPTGGYPTGSYPSGGYSTGSYSTDGRGRRGSDTDGRGRRRGFADLTGVDQVPNRNDDYGVELDDLAADRPRKRGRSLIIMTMVIVMLAFVVLGGLLGYRKAMDYFGTPDYAGMGTGSVAVTVADGDSATVIAETLYKDGVIKSAKAFIKAADADPNSVHIQVGTFTLHQHMSAKNALAMLLAIDGSGNPVNALVYKVSLPEGMITLDIYAKLSAVTHIPVADFVAAGKDPVALGVDPSWFVRDDGKKSYKSIEGFLFPATYSFQPGETAKQMLSTMVTKFKQVVAADGLNFVSIAKNTLQITPYEVLITASIAQVEGVDPQDMAGIARVIYNRIYKNTEAGRTLGLDSTVNYWLRLQGKDAKPSSQLTPSELNNKNDPFNTHGQPGFPIGAISNPGEAALKAALHPDPKRKDDAYFQTVGTSTKVLFARTYAEFQAQQK